MNIKGRIIAIISVTILFIGIAILVWANQTGKISIWGSEIIVGEGEICRGAVNAQCDTGLACLDPTTKLPAGNVGICYKNANKQSCTASSECKELVCQNGFIHEVCENNYCVLKTSCNIYDVTASSNPTNWTTTISTGSENPTQEFTANTDVSPIPSGTCNVGSWEATKVDSRLKLKGPLASVFSDKANGSNFIGDATGCESLTKPQTKFTAQYDIAGLTKGVYTSEITLIGKYLDNTSASVKIPVNITVTDSTTQTDTEPPIAPTKLTATVNSSTQVTITWTPSTDNVAVTGYDLYNADTNAHVVGMPGLNDSINDNKIVLSNLTANTTYRYYLKAHDAVPNYSLPSNPVSVTTPNSGFLPKPNNLQAQLVDCRSVKLTWDAIIDNTNVKGFNIYNKSDNSLVVVVNGYSYTISGLSEKTNHEYYLKSHDSSGNVSEASNSASATTSLCVNKLISTGQALWFNILIALILSAIISFFIMKKK